MSKLNIDQIRSRFRKKPRERITGEDLEKASREDLQHEVIIQQDRAEQAEYWADAFLEQLREREEAMNDLFAQVQAARRGLDDIADKVEATFVDILAARGGDEGYLRAVPKPEALSEMGHVTEGGEYPQASVDRGRTDEQIDEVVKKMVEEGRPRDQG